jgi:hypothetical protein
MSEIIPEIPPASSQINTRIEFGGHPDGSPNRSSPEGDSLNESFAGIVTSFTVYKLLNELMKPFTAMEAYKRGLIDANGNILKKEYEISPKDSSVLTPFNRLVIGIKRLIQALPANRYKADFGYLSTAARALAFECTELGGDGELFLEELQKSLDVLLEEGEAGNSIGGGFLNPQVGEPNIALAGVSPPIGMSRRKTAFGKNLEDINSVAPLRAKKLGSKWNEYLGCPDCPEKLIKSIKRKFWKSSKEGMILRGKDGAMVVIRNGEVKE